MCDEISDRAPSWDQAVADSALGKMVLVGITYLASDRSTVIRQEQVFGVIVSVDQAAGVAIRRKGAQAGECVTLPPDLSLFSPASPGEYRLRSTGEVVTDPDFVSQWTVTEPIKY